MPPILTFQMPGRLIFGLGAIAQLPDCVRGLGSQKALLVTDGGLVRAGIAGRVSDLLTQAGVAHSVFDGVEPDPHLAIVDASLAAARDCACDLVIGLGGGSPLDIAKLTSILMTNGGAPLDYVGIGKVPKPGLPTILIPTTSGTGSEVTPNSVLTDRAERLKKGIVSPFQYASVALVDPELTVGLPPAVTASTGIDALTHAIEAYTNKYAQPFVDTIALEAVRLIGANLRRAVACGEDVQARYNMALASVYGGLTLGPVNTGAAHALAYPLGGIYNVPHGVANSLLLPYVMRYNLISDLGKFARIAEALGVPTDGLSLRAAAERAVEAVVELCADIGIVSRLRDLSIPADAIDEMAAAAMKVTRLLNLNPRKVTEADARAIYRAAW